MNVQRQMSLKCPATGLECKDQECIDAFYDMKPLSKGEQFEFVRWLILREVIKDLLRQRK
jgi:hypothetical protein